MAQKISARTLVVDPSTFFRNGVVLCLREGEYEVLGEASQPGEALNLLTLSPDLILIGSSFAEEEALAVCRELRSHSSRIKLLLVTEHSGDLLFQVDGAAAGANGLLPPTARHEECWATIEKVLAGHPLFPREVLKAAFQPILVTKQELQVLKRWAEGKSDPEIAELLKVTLDTIHTHARNILQKLQVKNRQDAVRRARRRGMI